MLLGWLITQTQAGVQWTRYMHVMYADFAYAKSAQALCAVSVACLPDKAPQEEYTWLDRTDGFW